MTVTPINTQDASVSTVSNGNSFVKYTITNTNGCSNSRTMNTNVVTCASKPATAMAQKEFMIYPNPVQSILNIICKKANGAIVVTDLFGKQIKQQALTMGTNAIDVSGFVKGTYFVSIVTENGKETKKVVVE
ncbi:MAG: T9SS C-terminal target domain-containing protein [Rhodocyclales bacterium]|nr:T9SS C-terminal target domain-containing protein [Rhodocyclales bacterium]